MIWDTIDVTNNFKTILEQHSRIEFSQITSSNIDEVIFEYYKVIRGDTFNNNWHSFCAKVKKIYFKDSPCLFQTLPSIKIILPNQKNIYCKTSCINGVEYNFHKDSDQPAYHPEWETNFWLPLTEVNEHNTLYFLDEVPTKCIVKKNLIVCFKGGKIIHGCPTENISNSIRISLDFRGLSFEDYKPETLTNKPIVSRGKVFKQNKYYVIGKYYKLY